MVERVVGVDDGGYGSTREEDAVVSVWAVYFFGFPLFLLFFCAVCGM